MRAVSWYQGYVWLLYLWKAKIEVLDFRLIPNSLPETDELDCSASMN